MASACALAIISGKNIFICSSETPAGVSELLFHGRGRNGKRQLVSSPSPSLLRKSTSPKGRGKSTPGSFLIAPKTSAMSLTAWLSLRESWRGSA